MAFETKLNLNSYKSKQISGDTLNLSGCTHIFGEFELASGGTLSILPNRGAGKVLTSDANGLGTWQINSNISAITGATNGLTRVGNQVILGGNLTGTTIISGNFDNFDNCFTLSINNFDFDIGGKLNISTCCTTLRLDDVSLATNGVVGIFRDCGVVISSIDTFNNTCGVINICSSIGNIDVKVTSGLTFCSTNNKPIIYFADYSANYTNRSLVDKEYVDNKVFSGTTNGITGATNLGSGNGTIFTSVSANKINLKTLSGGTNITLTCDGNYIGINSSASSVLSVCTISGNSAATGFTVNHGCNQQFVMVQVVQAASPYSTVYTDIQRPNTNCVCITFDTAPLTGTNYKILITG